MGTNLDRLSLRYIEDDVGKAPIHLATINGHCDVVKYFIDIAPDTINFQSDDGKTPLHYAVLVGEYEIYNLLVERGADLTIRDSKGFTPKEYMNDVIDDIRCSLIGTGYNPCDEACEKLGYDENTNYEDENVSYNLWKEMVSITNSYPRIEFTSNS